MTELELHEAAAAGDLDLVEGLLRSHRCDPNHRDVDWGYRTPLHWASAGGHAEVVRVLVESGARPCVRTDTGRTPAHCAAEAGRLGVLRLLHALRAPVDLEDVSGDRPIRMAEMYGHADCVHFLKIAEIESKAYRQTAEEQGIILEDTEDQWRAQLEEEDGLEVKK